MDDLDFLIPVTILHRMQLDQFDFVLNLSARSCNGCWPSVRVKVENKIVFDGTVIENQQVRYNSKVNNANEINVCISYYNKKDTDTIVDSTGQIIENQSLEITELTVNGIDLVKTQIIYNLGMFYQDLLPAKQQYFIDHGFDIGPSHTLLMCENGDWRLKFQVPIMQHFVRYKASQAPSERWPNPELLLEMYELIQDIRRLTKK